MVLMTLQQFLIFLNWGKILISIRKSNQKIGNVGPSFQDGRREMKFPLASLYFRQNGLE